MGITLDPDGEPVRMVTLTMLADQEYLALARTSAMHVAALLHLPLVQVTDLRLAVDEACTSFIAGRTGDRRGCRGARADGDDGAEL